MWKVRKSFPFKVSGNISSASQSQYEESQNFDAAVLDVESDPESEYEKEDLDLDDDDIPVSFPNALNLNEVSRMIILKLQDQRNLWSLARRSNLLISQISNPQTSGSQNFRISDLRISDFRSQVQITNCLSLIADH